jgi:hypothetical protein
MAKVKVMMSFGDRHTKQMHPVGEVFEASEERILEIKSVDPDLIQVILESSVEEPKRKRKKVES